MTDAEERWGDGESGLQWGHGAWPWMTTYPPYCSLGALSLQWGHGAWPWMTPILKPTVPEQRRFNGATAHGRG